MQDLVRHAHAEQALEQALEPSLSKMIVWLYWLSRRRARLAGIFAHSSSENKSLVPVMSHTCFTPSCMLWHRDNSIATSLLYYLSGHVGQ